MLLQTTMEEDESTEQRLKSWRRRLQDPSLIQRFQAEHDNGARRDAAAAPTFTLIHTPWQLVHASSKNETTTTTASSTLAHYPLEDHLTIRQAQNEGFCQESLHKGVACAREGKANEAKFHYQQGLDLMPDHVDLLVAMGALLANQQNFVAALQHLQKAVSLDPQHANAADYLRQVQAAAQQPITKTTKSAAARQDVLLEQSLTQRSVGSAVLAGVAGSSGVAAAAAGATAQYDLLPDSASDDAESSLSSRKQRRKRKKRKDKKRHKRKRRHRKRDDDSSNNDDNDDAVDDSSNDASSSSDDRRRRRKKRRRKKRSKKRRRSDDGSFSSSGTVDSLKLVDKKLKHHDA